jgi:hypothetical protein
VFEKEDAVIVALGAIASEQEARDCIWRHFPKAFIEPDKKAKAPLFEDFYNIADEFKVDNPNSSIRSLQEAKLNNKTIEIKRKTYEISGNTKPNNTIKINDTKLIIEQIKTWFLFDSFSLINLSNCEEIMQ